MSLSVKLQMRQSQSLVMTPQLMQSIRLLQFNHAELHQFIEQEVERNPLLELVGEGREPDTGERSEPRAPEPAPAAQTASERMTESLDSDYENVYQDDHGAARPDAPELAASWKSMPGASGRSVGEGVDVDEFAATPLTLRDHVTEQISFAFAKATERAIAHDLADHLDPAGYFAGEACEIALRLGVGVERVESVLSRMRQFEPAGIFARSLSECLAIQLERKDRLDPAMAALLDHHLLGIFLKSLSFEAVVRLLFLLPATTVRYSEAAYSALARVHPTVKAQVLSQFLDGVYETDLKRLANIASARVCGDPEGDDNCIRRRGEEHV